MRCSTLSMLFCFLCIAVVVVVAIVVVVSVVVGVIHFRFVGGFVVEAVLATRLFWIVSFS